MNSEHKPKLGFIGLGDMGRPMVTRMLAAGFELIAYDLDAVRIAACTGAQPADDAKQVVEQADIVMTSLPSSAAFVQLAEQQLLPHARAGQFFIEFGTTTPSEVRRLAGAFAARGAQLIDAPVSGGPRGAESGALYVFVGGDASAVERCRFVFEMVGEPQTTTYCGPSGCGQVVKGVNQLMMGLGGAAYLEAVAFGVRAGVDPKTIAQALGNQGRWRRDLAFIAEAAASQQADTQGVKFRELPYFLREAQAQEFALPLTQALYEFCDAGERVTIDDKRPAPSFWHQLMQAKSGI